MGRIQFAGTFGDRGYGKLIVRSGELSEGPALGFRIDVGGADVQLFATDVRELREMLTAWLTITEMVHRRDDL